MYIIILFAIGIFLGSTGAILFKVGGRYLPEFSISLNYFFHFFMNVYIFVGFLLYFIPAVIWVYVLTKYPVAFVQPILSLTYVVTPIMAMIFIGESVPLFRWFGIVIIIVGVSIVSMT